MPVIEETGLLRHLLETANGTSAPIPPPRENSDADETADRTRQPPGGWRPRTRTSVPAAELSLDEVLARHRSVRVFGPKPALASELGWIVAAGLAAERRQWPYPVHPSLGITFALAAFDVAALAPGFYLSTHHPGEEFWLIHREPWTQELRHRYADAPAVLLVCGDLSTAGQAMGQTGYGQLLVRAAAAGYAAWLRAISFGLAGTVFDGTCHQVTASLSQAGWPGLRHLFTVAVGTPG